MIVKIDVSIRNPKTCSAWAKKVTGANLNESGSYALEGDWLTKVRGGEFVANNLADGDLVAVGYRGGSWKNTEVWVALIKVTEGTSDSADGVTYGDLEVENGKVVFFGSDRRRSELMEIAILHEAQELNKCTAPGYVAALIYSRERDIKAPSEVITVKLSGAELDALNWLRRMVADSWGVQEIVEAAILHYQLHAEQIYNKTREMV